MDCNPFRRHYDDKTEQGWAERQQDEGGASQVSKVSGTNMESRKRGMLPAESELGVVPISHMGSRDGKG